MTALSSPLLVERRPALHGATDFVSWTWEMLHGGHDEVGFSSDGSRIVVKVPLKLGSNSSLRRQQAHCCSAHGCPAFLDSESHTAVS